MFVATTLLKRAGRGDHGASADGAPVTLKFADAIGEMLTAGPATESIPPLPFKMYTWDPLNTCVNTTLDVAKEKRRSVVV